MIKFFARLLGGTRMEFVGKDTLGNTYYYVFRGASQPKRYCENENNDPNNIDIPPAWQAWLTGTRREPPSSDEAKIPVFKSEPSPVDGMDKLFSPNKGIDHASAPSAGPNIKFKDKSEPESKGDTFQPGSWSPK